ncbi:hypothetical protein S40285_00387 [Stachybotrys chlorohalonatus IBT 40285]|uniref:Cytoplasmic tRNA 2-thiolation protein 2 n=1 Tax=Stachybotrys chlorohalonatus (strain IBT 40285) TaxID=1283841 RepID=A0A084QHK1_STAC4|nr:hypothetical protein S40285_00387 [Stachybotrys chlorohalonata IBT 40285]
MPDSKPAKPCKRCKDPDAPYKLRNEPSCRKCFVEYVDTKVIKRMAVALRETRTSHLPGPRRYLAGLSFGPSSSALVHILDAQAEYQKANNPKSALEVLVLHVDTDLSYPGVADAETPAQRLLARYRDKYPHLSHECLHLNKALDIETVDWTSLPPLEGQDASARLRNLFDRLPSVTSRADILRQLVRHLLLHVAIDRGYQALFLGHNTTSLAALTLAEVANGRGFAIPWQVNDGRVTICTYNQSSNDPGKVTAIREFPIFSPLREVLSAEIAIYRDIIPSLGELAPADTSSATSVVSHKDLSIEEVMARYFSGVEGPYSGIVANVVRTAGKLERTSAGDFCRLCSVPLDEEGDSTWAGEMGPETERTASTHQQQKLCYGCSRSLKV